MRPTIVILAGMLLFFSCATEPEKHTGPLKISENHRFLVSGKDDPFFWLGDTGWLLFKKLSREEAEKYLENRKQKGFNVIQVMVIHDIVRNTNFYGDSAFRNLRCDLPMTTEGASPDDPIQYDYWDHVDYIVKLAGEKGIFLAMVPVWGSNVRGGKISAAAAEKYAAWLAERYGNEPNIIWLNGGDVKGSDSIETWNTIGNQLRTLTHNQLITFHPFGRTQSSEWFHNEKWLDFNMFQSGHKSYDQDTTGLCYGEDNWRYMKNDYGRIPVKPSLDGEPSYESIPHGLHDPSQPYWTDADIRRYAYWSVFAGGSGFTYGHNAIMQFHKPDDKSPAYGVKEFWEDALEAPGASQMIFLKNLILSRPYFERVPSQELIAGETGMRYDYIAATRGKDYLFAYTFNGTTININSETLGWNEYTAKWFDPRNGKSEQIGVFRRGGDQAFDPPGELKPGNDWVLIIDKIR